MALYTEQLSKDSTKKSSKDALKKAADSFTKAQKATEEADRQMKKAAKAWEAAIDLDSVDDLTENNVNEWVEAVWRKMLIWNVKDFVSAMRRGASHS